METNSNCGHCLTKLEHTPNICNVCRRVRSWCDTCKSEKCSIQDHKKRTLVDDKGMDCKSYCNKCKKHPKIILKGFKDPEHDPWCIGISINSNKPQDQNFMPFTKYNRMVVEEQMGEFPMKTGRIVKGGAVRNMEERYAEKWIAWNEGKFCGGY